MSEQEREADNSRPLVSVVTPTHDRPGKLRRAIASVRAQTYQPIEHVIVADGPQCLEVQTVADEYPGVRYVELGRNWHVHAGKEDWGATPRMVGTYLARGEYIAFLDDDNVFVPQHVEKLVNLMVTTGTDFVWSRLARFRAIGGAAESEVGNGVPYSGGIDTSQIMVRPELLRVANWRTAGYGADWDLVERWLAQGATNAFLPETTVHYEIQR